MNVLVRRHSHSALERPLQRTASAPTYSPYPVPSPAPARSASVRSDRNRSFTDVTLVARPEYIWEGYCLPGPLVPQQQYTPHTASDRRRYVEQAELRPPIYFKRVEPVELGISLVDCLAQRFKRLQGYDDELLQDAGPSISIRLNWEGYDPWSRQIPTRNFKVPQGPITRKVLAKNIAKTVQRFIDEHIDRQLPPNSNPAWQVGPGRIEFNDVVLLSIHHVSRGSWQANLCLNQPLETILSKSMQSAYHT
ncbi:uncharacterized protein FOMMEDRAFT_73265 [Fomitiporia mediterranea MF3/22]|uniref:uncharacterized protein n=1 Tax=Fomitiporia mediterranea (strain MF3/22) TaxID=694068 RepID=UPI0004408759|nr:uncharacterized protein FOMMEDRAFT_73265 [Fomitiporia mediterranea MF3/22]EJD07501.1 hypothetical protein FOMMEDRAFT_73265 [Fomitiporia mediterranea MF3/22]